MRVFVAQSAVFSTRERAERYLFAKLEHDFVDAIAMDDTLAERYLDEQDNDVLAPEYQSLAALVSINAEELLFPVNELSFAVDEQVVDMFVVTEDEE